MNFVNITPRRGINLDHIEQWEYFPSDDDSRFVMSTLTLQMNSGQTITLFSQKADALHILLTMAYADGVLVPDEDS